MASQMLSFGFTFHFMVSYIQESEEFGLIISFSIPNRTLKSECRISFLLVTLLLSSQTPLGRRC